MAYFDIEKFYQQNHIDYITKGTNVKAGEVNISCPFCNSSGNPDPSKHLGVDSKRGYFSCWRNDKHRGKTLHRLIMKILRCSYDKACDVLGVRQTYIDNDFLNEFLDNPESYFYEEVKEKKPLSFPKEFKNFGKSRMDVPYKNYLINRGFEKDDIEELCEIYGLKYVTDGRYSNRIILPIYMDGELVSWTGRSISKNVHTRYLSLSEKEGAFISIKDTIFNFDFLLNNSNDFLYVVEGPFDALKIDYFGYDFNANATCIFSKVLRQSQIQLLHEVSHNFKKIIILLDPEELEANQRSLDSLYFLGNKVVVGEMPENFEDPGALDKKSVIKLIRLNK